jgi:hypothetical protein
MEVVMLEQYFLKPATVDRIRASWIGDPIEQYVDWLAENGYAARNVLRRVPLLVRFGAFAAAQGAMRWDELPVRDVRRRLAAGALRAHPRAGAPQGRG